MRIFALAIAAVVYAAPALAAERSYSVTSFDRIRLDGDYKVSLVTGVAPFARASGSARAIDGVDIEVQGRTLIIRRNRSPWGGYPGEGSGPVEINVGTHELSTAWVNGAGSLAIDRVEAMTFQTEVQGAGQVAVGRIEADQVKLGLTGAASARLAGKAEKMTAIVRGSSQLDAEGLKVEDLVLAAEGPAIARASASETAKVDGAGVATITLTGKPACIVKMTGSATVSGCEKPKR